MTSATAQLPRAAAFDDWRELDHRSSDGIAVTLLWSRSRDHVRVAVTDRRTGHSFDLDVPGRDALPAFHHPFAYASAR